LQAELEAELSARIDAYAEAAVELAAARAKVLSTVEDQLLGLAVDIAEALVEDTLEADPELHVRLARSAIEALGSSAGARLRASRQAFESITDVHGEAFVVVNGIRVEVVLDPTLDGLGCVADNEIGAVDGRIPERLRAVRRALAEERRERSVKEQT
jgi:flagellar biosynthesis/type III secretory pathway protein FliH